MASQKFIKLSTALQFGLCSGGELPDQTDSLFARWAHLGRLEVKFGGEEVEGVWSEAVDVGEVL